MYIILLCILYYYVSRETLIFVSFSEIILNNPSLSLSLQLEFGPLGISSSRCTFSSRFVVFFWLRSPGVRARDIYLHDDLNIYNAQKP